MWRLELAAEDIPYRENESRPARAADVQGRHKKRPAGHICISSAIVLDAKGWALVPASGEVRISRTEIILGCGRSLEIIPRGGGNALSRRLQRLTLAAFP